MTSLGKINLKIVISAELFSTLAIRTQNVRHLCSIQLITTAVLRRKLNVKLQTLISVK